LIKEKVNINSMGLEIIKFKKENNETVIIDYEIGEKNIKSKNRTNTE